MDKFCGAQSGEIDAPGVLFDAILSTSVTVIDTAQPTASVASVLSTLTVARITELAREAGLAPKGRRKDEVVESVAKTGRIRFRALLSQLRRDELQAACREHRLPDSGRARQELMQRLLTSHGAHDSAPPPPLFSGTAPERKVPRPGDTIVARHRQWLVDDVKLPPNEGDATWVELTCLDDDHRGQPLELLWELELGAKVIDPEAHGLGEVERLDPPRHFGAYLHALRWQGVTAAEKNYFQAPFRAGIEVLAHQLTPLQKALSLPRANLFIADDVGLGKTIEAGLVLQELLLRQRVEFTLIVAPASVTLQWQGEMEQRFGLRFEIYSREFVLARRQERGFGINPWTTHTRFIISYPLLRRPEYRDPLLAHLSTLSQTGSRSSSRAKKSLLILDEAHTAAPASGGRYAVDSQTTHVVRDIAPRFENRLFLSATPHNGHSNSFSALLEILDPQRFTRGVPVKGREQLREVMVRRLKRDLRQLTHSMRFPERKVVRMGIAMEPAEGNEPANELSLAKTLAEYTSLFAELPKTKRLPLINLQKRLLSSVEAFARTLKVHAKSKQRAVAAIDSDEEADAEHTLGLDDDALDEREEQRVASASAALHKIMPEGAEALLASMHDQAEQLRREPDAKVRALMAWMRDHLCPAIGDRDSKDTAWTDRRVLIFTEYGDTRRYLMGLLREAVRHTEGGEDRVDQIHGGMNEQAREEVQYAFNAAPAAEPLRILVATDAAREGLNLQAHCADLFHFDIPWNPSRMEQRNGRIDRALQPSPEVRCHYFVYDPPARRPRARKGRRKNRGHQPRARLPRRRSCASESPNALDPGISATTVAAIEDATDLDKRRATLGDRAVATANRGARRRAASKRPSQREMKRALQHLRPNRKSASVSVPSTCATRSTSASSLFGADAPRPCGTKTSAGVFALPDLPDPTGTGDPRRPTSSARPRRGLATSGASKPAPSRGVHCAARCSPIPRCTSTSSTPSCSACSGAFSPKASAITISPASPPSPCPLPTSGANIGRPRDSADCACSAAALDVSTTRCWRRSRPRRWHPSAPRAAERASPSSTNNKAAPSSPNPRSAACRRRPPSTPSRPSLPHHPLCGTPQAWLDDPPPRPASRSRCPWPSKWSSSSRPAPTSRPRQLTADPREPSATPFRRRPRQPAAAASTSVRPPMA